MRGSNQRTGFTASFKLQEISGRFNARRGFERKAGVAAGQKRRGKAPAAPSDKPEARAQRNFTDPESRIMKDGASKAFEQCYNAQAAVDEQAQIIVAAEVTREANDKRQVAPMVAAIEQTMREVNGPAPAAAGRAAAAAAEVGSDAPRRLPEVLSADKAV